MLPKFYKVGFQLRGLESVSWVNVLIYCSIVPVLYNEMVTLSLNRRPICLCISGPVHQFGYYIYFFYIIVIIYAYYYYHKHNFFGPICNEKKFSSGVTEVSL